MKRLILFTVLSFCLVFSASAWNPMVVTGGSASCDTTNIELWTRFEALDFSGTNSSNAPCVGAGTGEDCSSNDEVWTMGGGSQLGATGKYYGTSGYYSFDDYDYGVIDEPSVTMDDEGSLGFWLRLVGSWTVSDVDTYIMRVFRSDNDLIRLETLTSGELRFAWRDNSTTRTALDTLSADLVADTWYFVQLSWKTADNDRWIYVDGNLEVSDLTSTIGSFSLDVTNIYLGPGGATAPDLVIYVDNLIYSTDSTLNLYTACAGLEDFPN